MDNAQQPTPMFAAVFPPPNGTPNFVPYRLTLWATTGGVLFDDVVLAYEEASPHRLQLSPDDHKRVDAAVGGTVVGRADWHRHVFEVVEKGLYDKVVSDLGDAAKRIGVLERELARATGTIGDVMSVIRAASIAGTAALKVDDA